MMPRQPTAVDLFSGAGGLSLGVEQAGFKVVAAVELDPTAALTYAKNHRRTVVFNQDICDVTGKSLLATTPGGKLDLLMGCAPCQGFCQLTVNSSRQDPRNRLISQMSRLVRETMPRAVIMENVPGLLTRGRNLFADFVSTLRSAGYEVVWGNLQMADYGVPQMRRRLLLIASRDRKPTLPPPTHTREGDAGKLPWISLREAIYGERPPRRLSKASPRRENWHVIRDLRSDTIARLRATGPGDRRYDLPDGLLPKCHRAGYIGFPNVYMRMDWNRPAPTITSGCTTPARGRFGHPDRRRLTISVREAATLQTFPKSYRFYTDSMEAVCEMIGNAVPPTFAKVVGEHVKATLL